MDSADALPSTATMKSAASLLSFIRFAAEHKYRLYVLLLLTLVYMVNQLSTFCLIATNTGMAQEMGYGKRVCEVCPEGTVSGKLANDTDGCEDSDCHSWPNQSQPACCWRYTGEGLAYQLLAGPLYILLFSTSAIPMGLWSELRNINKTLVLFICAFLWSALTIASGFSTEYWHVAVARMLIGILSAPCVPFCASIITSYFSKETHGAALGFYNWGIYVGYSITFLLLIAERAHGWRYVYFIAGIPGLLLSFFVLFTIRLPEAPLDFSVGNSFPKLKRAVAHICNPLLLLLCLGGAIRNGAGLVWAYNINPFFAEYHPETKVEEWMSWIPLVFGSVGAFAGGVISDRLSRSWPHGVTGRCILLVASQLISAPFLLGTLLFPMPWAFISHIPAYFFGEMWIGVCLAVVIEIVPKDLTASCAALYFFIIQIVGGNMTLLVPPLQGSLSLRQSLIVAIPGMYVLASLTFTLVIFCYNCTGIELLSQQDQAMVTKL